MKEISVIPKIWQKIGSVLTGRNPNMNNIANNIANKRTIKAWQQQQQQHIHSHRTVRTKGRNEAL